MFKSSQIFRWVHLATREKTSRRVLLAATLFILGPLSHQLAHSAEPASVDKSAPCAALAQLSGNAIAEPTARIVTAKLNAPSEARVIPGAPEWMPPTPAMPEHCEVVGTMRERTGSDGQRYAVRFRLRLPTNWNGRFLFEGGGGTNGMLATLLDARLEAERAVCCGALPS